MVIWLGMGYALITTYIHIVCSKYTIHKEIRLSFNVSVFMIKPLHFIKYTFRMNLLATCHMSGLSLKVIMFVHG